MHAAGLFGRARRRVVSPGFLASLALGALLSEGGAVRSSGAQIGAAVRLGGGARGGSARPLFARLLGGTRPVRLRALRSGRLLRRLPLRRGSALGCRLFRRSFARFRLFTLASSQFNRSRRYFGVE